MRKKWLKVGLGAIAASSLIAGVCTLNVGDLTASAAVASQDITELDMCNNAVPGGDGNATVGSDSAFNFNEVQSVATGEHRIHVEGQNYWSYDTATKYFDISFQMEFADWGDSGYIAFNTAGNNQLRIYNHKIETKALVGTGYEGRHQEQAFAEEITSGWHTVRMVLDCAGATSDSGHNTFTAKVVIDGVETSYDWFAEDWGGNAYYLMNNTGTAVNVLSSNSPLPKDISELAISNGAIGNAGTETAFNFNEVQVVATGEHRIHVDKNYGQWNTSVHDINVSFQVEFADWGDGYIAFRMSGDNEIRLYNDKVETVRLVGTDYEGQHTSKAFAEEITSGWHKVRLSYTDGKQGCAGGDSNFTVKAVIDGVEYSYSHGGMADWASGSAFRLINQTGKAVKMLSTNVEAPEPTPEPVPVPNDAVYTNVTAVDIASMLISNGAKGNAGAETAFAFNTGDSVTAVENRVHTAGSGYWSWDTATKEMSVDLKMEFTDWKGGWFGFRVADNTELRMYNDKIELSGDDGVSKGTASFAEKIASDWHTVNFTYQYGTKDGATVCSRLTVTIDGTAYEVAATYFTDYKGHPFMLMNKTGVAVNVLSPTALAPDEEPEGEMTFTDVPVQDIADMDISDGALGVVQNPFNFNVIDEVSATENRVHYKNQGYYQWDVSTQEINVNMHLEFTEWNGGWFGFRTAGHTELRIFNDKIEINADGSSKGVKAFEKPINIGWHTVNINYQFRSSVESGEVNGSRLTVTIDGTAYEVKTNYYPNYSGHAVVLINNTGDPVNVLSAKQSLPETTYSKVKKQQIEDLFIANGGSAFDFTAVENVEVGKYNFFTDDTFATEDTALGKDITLKVQFSYWGDGYIGFEFSNASVRIYNDKIAIFSRNTNGEFVSEVASTKLTSPVYSGWHILRVVYQNKFVKGEAVGSRLQVTVDGTVYETECSFINEAGNPCKLVNATKNAVEITSQNTVTLKDLSEWWIINNALRNNGYTYRAGAENAFNFLYEETVAKGDHIFHDKPDYWSLATTYSVGGFEFIMSFDDWNKAGTEDADGNPIIEDGYFAIRIGATIVRIYTNRAELHSSANGGDSYEKKDSERYGRTYEGMQDVTLLIERGEAGTKVTLTIAGNAYTLESDVAPSTTHSFLINETGTNVKIQSLLKKKMTAFVESYLDYDNYYEREIEEAHALIKTALEKMNNASARANIDSFIAALCRKLDALPTIPEVDAMIQANAEYKNTVMANIEAQLGELKQEDYTSAQWAYLSEVAQKAYGDFAVARNEAETDAIGESFLAEVQLIMEDASKLDFYLADITERLQNTTDATLTATLQNALTAIQGAGFASECVDAYLSAVQAMEGNGKSEIEPDSGLQDGGDFEDIDPTDNEPIDSTSGCGASLEIACVAAVAVLVLAIFTMRRKEE